MASSGARSAVVDVALARRLLAGQCPAFARRPLVAVPSTGTDNALFRLGDDLVLRLPRVDWAAPQPAREHTWLPRLAPALPLPIPQPLVLGAPAEGYPFAWAIHRWIEGETLEDGGLADPVGEARRLGAFVSALGALDATGGPLAGRANNGRGAPLALRDERVRACLAELEDEVDTARVLEIWERDAGAAVHAGPPCWVHGDIHLGNLLARQGRISAVIDFGTLGVGDPAVDLLPAWDLFGGDARAAYREATGADDARWARGRAWALSVAVIAWPYYRETNPAIVRHSERVVAEVLAEVAAGG